MTKAQNVEEYIAQQRAFIAQNPDCGNSHYNLAVALVGQQKDDEAEKDLHDALDCSSNMAEAYVLLGGIALQRGDLEGCLKNNKMSVKARPGFSEGYGYIGFVELKRVKIDVAIKNLERATKFNFRYIQAFANLANAYLMKGLIDESIETSKKANQHNADFATAHNNLAISYLEKEAYDLAVEHADKAVELGYEMAPEILSEIDEHRRQKTDNL